MLFAGSLDKSHRDQLEAIGKLEEFLGDPPTVPYWLSCVWRDYWRMRKRTPVEDPISLQTMMIWLEIEDRWDLIDRLLPYYEAMDVAFREWIGEQREQKMQQHRRSLSAKGG